MMVVGVKADISAMLKTATDLEREQGPFAQALALTRTAQFTRDELVKEMDSAFDRPTPFTKNALYVKPATKKSLTAQVKVKDEAVKGNPAVRWLLPEISGGTRNTKGFENLLIRAGILASGWYCIPTDAAPLDAYGNVPGSVINKILSQLQAARDSLANEPADKRDKRNRRRLEGRYFAVLPYRSPTNNLHPGIYERLGGARGKIVPIFIFTQARPSYSKRYRFYEIGERVARDRFPIEFRAAMAQAVATARAKAT